jgi:LysR family transcriptional regulator, nod-box dependent transcriptional activator
VRFEGLDLNLLVAFNVLMSERNVTAAARRLNLSQSAMSAAIGRLRGFFNDELFLMVGRRLMPTPLALSLELPTRNVLSQIRANLIARPDFDPSRSTRRFRMIVSDYASTVLINEVLRHVYSQAPRVTFELIPFDDRVDEPLRQGEVDFLIFPEPSLSDEHPKVHLFTDTFCCVASADNAMVGKRLSVKQYLEAGHVTALFGPGRRLSYEERALRQLGFDRRIEVVVQNFIMMAIMVVGTERIATLHRRLAEKFVELLPLRLLAMPITIPEIREFLQWPTLLDGDPAIAWLREVIVGVARDLDSGAKARHSRNPNLQLAHGR